MVCKNFAGAQARLTLRTPLQEILDPSLYSFPYNLLCRIFLANFSRNFKFLATPQAGCGICCLATKVRSLFPFLYVRTVDLSFCASGKLCSPGYPAVLAWLQIRTIVCSLQERLQSGSCWVLLSASSAPIATLSCSSYLH